MWLPSHTSGCNGRRSSPRRTWCRGRRPACSHPAGNCFPANRERLCVARDANVPRLRRLEPAADALPTSRARGRASYGVCRGGRVRAYADRVVRVSSLILVGALLTCAAFVDGCTYDFDIGSESGNAQPEGGTSDSSTSDSSSVPMGGQCNGSACVCPARSSCDIDCPLGSVCATRCEKGSKCSINCPSSKCGTTCEEGASCNVNCGGGSCGTRCLAGSQCEVNCLGGKCTIDCQGGACSFTSCLGGDCKCVGTGCP